MSEQETAKSQGNIDSLVDCPACNGKKRLQCNKCSGKGRLRCGDCSGRGTPDCPNPRCRGGTITHTDIVVGTAEKNLGGGTIIRKEECGTCGGLGYMRGETCTRCDGKGRVICRSCGGRGDKPCEMCKETGRVTNEEAKRYRRKRLFSNIIILVLLLVIGLSIRSCVNYSDKNVPPHAAAVNTN